MCEPPLRPLEGVIELPKSVMRPYPLSKGGDIASLNISAIHSHLPPSKVASQHFLDLASTPAHSRGGEYTYLFNSGQSVGSGRKHLCISFFDQRAISETRIRTRKPCDSREFAGDGEAGAIEKAAR